jgi:hypothetical protein
MSCAGYLTRSLPLTRLTAVTLGVAAALVAACSGPTNPEPILMQPQAITLGTDAQGSVTVIGTMGAVENADAVQIVDLQTQFVVEVSLNPDGSFGATLAGTTTDSFRLTARRRADGASAVVHLTGNPNGTATATVVENLGCLSVSPTDLDLGVTSAGEPVYGELTVTNGCAEPVPFVQVTSSNAHFTVASLLAEQVLEPGASATVSVTFMGPGGEETAMILIEPALVTDPTQVPLLVTVRATAMR